MTIPPSCSELVLSQLEDTILYHILKDLKPLPLWQPEWKLLISNHYKIKYSYILRKTSVHQEPLCYDDSTQEDNHKPSYNTIFLHIKCILLQLSGKFIRAADIFSSLGRRDCDRTLWIAEMQLHIHSLWL